MKTLIKLILLVIFIIVIHILIALTVKNYVDWIINKKIIWIILITIIAIFISGTILNHITILIRTIIKKTPYVEDVVFITSIILRGFYAYFLYLLIDFSILKSVLICLFMAALFYGLSNTFLNRVNYEVIMNKVFN